MPTEAHSTMEWDNLRLVLAISRACTLTGAASALHVSVSTVSRRLSALEEALKVRLFDRLPDQFLPTPACGYLIAVAESLEDQIKTAEQKVRSHDSLLKGTLRITSPYALAQRFMPPILAQCRLQYPDIQIEHIVGNRLLDLLGREADIALRPVRPTQNSLLGRKLMDVAVTFYASHAYVQRHGRPSDIADLKSHTLIGSMDLAMPPHIQKWLWNNTPQDKAMYKSNTLPDQILAAQEGLGIVLLPCAFGDTEPSLTRVLPIIDVLTHELWLVSHMSLRHVARVRVVMDIIASALAYQRDLFEGHRPWTPEQMIA